MNPQELVDEAIQQQQLRPEDRVDQEALRLAQLQKQRDLEQQHAGWLEQTITKNKIQNLVEVRDNYKDLAEKEAIAPNGKDSIMKLYLLRAYTLNVVIKFLQRQDVLKTSIIN